jgi:hypothetical protein
VVAAAPQATAAARNVPPQGVGASSETLPWLSLQDSRN